MEIVESTIADVNKGRDGAAQIEQGMEFDGRFGLAVGGPGKQRQAQFDEGGVEGIDGLGQIECERFVGVELPRCGNQRLGKLGVDAPIAASIGIGQHAFADLSTNAEVV